MKYSILVPVYKVEPYLRKCLDSILEQGFNDFELILVDDGSPDNCGSICDEYAGDDARIKVIHKENGGLVSARQAAINEATGEYIINIDSDDWISKEFLIKTDEIVEKYHPDIISFAVGFLENDGSLNISYEPFNVGYYTREDMISKIYPNILMNDCMSHSHYFLCGKVFRKNLIIRHQLNVDKRIAMGEDVTCLMPTYADAKSVYVSDYAAYNICQHGDSMSRLFNMKQFDDVILGVESINKHEIKIAIPGFDKQIDRYVFHMCLVLLVGAASAKNGKELLPQIKEKMNHQLFREGVANAEFSQISAKSKLVLKLLKKNRVETAFSILSLIEHMKGRK